MYYEILVQKRYRRPNGSVAIERCSIQAIIGKEARGVHIASFQRILKVVHDVRCCRGLAVLDVSASMFEEICAHQAHNFFSGLTPGDDFLKKFLAILMSLTERLHSMYHAGPPRTRCRNLCRGRRRDGRKVGQTLFSWYRFQMFRLGP